MIKPACQQTAAREPADMSFVDDVDDTDGCFRLHLHDLIPGQQGEIVLFNDSALPHVVIEAPGEPIEMGEIAVHETAEGVAVDGFRFVRFGDGLVVFHDPDTRIVVEVVRD